jgi:hypothetical protein
VDVNALIVAEYIHDHVEERLDAFRRVQTRPDLFSNTTPPCGNKETDLQTVQNIIRRALRNPFAFYAKFIEPKLPG